MEHLFEIIVEYRAYAPWITFGLILLAGLNLPISIDVLIVINALLAANTIPEYTFYLFLSILVGCYLSAWISYYIGRKYGRKLMKYKWFSKILCQKKLNRVSNFYKKYGFFSLVIGRFVPCGFRNLIFMTTGMSKMSFKQFILRDAVAVLIWTGACFYIYYSIGLNFQTLLHYLKTFNILIFSTFVMTIIGVVWYKKRKKKAIKQAADKQKLDDS